MYPASIAGYSYPNGSVWAGERIVGAVAPLFIEGDSLFIAGERSGARINSSRPRRVGQVIGLKPDQIEAYERLHAAVWPEVLAMIHACNMRNYSIFRYGELLFAYFEYVGDDYEADMAKMAADPKTREWWTWTEPMQAPLETHSPGEWWSTIEQVAAAEGRLDILVNNAGISHVGNILETSLEDWERVMRVNARGVFLCAREAVRQMLAQMPAGGVIINMSSVAATIGIDRRLPYCASKGAVLALTRSIAIDFATQAIRCNAICPGTVQTPFVEGYLARNFAGHEDEVRQQLHARQPIGRMGRPDEIAYAALYLASDEASFVTGSALVIDGGWTAK